MLYNSMKQFQKQFCGVKSSWSCQWTTTAEEIYHETMSYIECSWGRCPSSSGLHVVLTCFATGQKVAQHSAFGCLRMPLLPSGSSFVVLCTRWATSRRSMAAKTVSKNARGNVPKCWLAIQHNVQSPCFTVLVTLNQVSTVHIAYLLHTYCTYFAYVLRQARSDWRGQRQWGGATRELSTLLEWSEWSQVVIGSHKEVTYCFTTQIWASTEVNGKHSWTRSKGSADFRLEVARTWYGSARKLNRARYFKSWCRKRSLPMLRRRAEDSETRTVSMSQNRGKMKWLWTQKMEGLVLQ